MSTRAGQPEHRRLFSFTDLSKPTTSEPRHSVNTHQHHFIEVARFAGLRSGISMCLCGESKTEWAAQA